MGLQGIPGARRRAPPRRSGPPSRRPPLPILPPRADITTAQVIPLGFLVALMVLFGCLVADRVAYTLGSPALKAVLHLGEMALVLACSLALYWSPLTSAGEPGGPGRVPRLERGAAAAGQAGLPAPR